MSEFNPTGNRTPPITGVTNDANLTPQALRVDVTTKRLLVDAGTITTTSASVGTTGAAVPASADYVGGNKAGNLTGVTLDASSNLNVNINAALPAGSAVIGHVISDSGSVTAATLNAETTKVIGVTRTADGAGNLLTSNSTTYTAKFAIDSNLLGTLGTAFTTAGKVDVKGADGDVFVRQATGTNLHMVVDSGTITTVSAVTAITNALPAGTNLMGKVGIDQTTVGTTNGVSLAQVGTTTVATGNGVVSAGVQRVAIASDNTAFSVNAVESGTWTVQPGNTANSTPWLVTDTPATSGGLSKFHLVSAATTNATNVKASAGQVYAITAYNLNASPRYLKFHNTAGTPTAGTAVTDSFLIPGNTAGAGFVINVNKGIAFATGIGITTTTGIADADTAAVAANEVLLNIYYK